MRSFSLGFAVFALFAIATACGASPPNAVAPPPEPAATAPVPAESASGASLPPLPSDVLDASADAPALTAEVPPPATPADAGAPVSTSACNEQSPQDFLIRGNFFEKACRRKSPCRFNTAPNQCGPLEGFGHPAPGEPAPSAFAVDTTFFGLRVKMHRKVVPALTCVEEEIHRSCADHPYTPHALAGIRFRNTYRGGEVTNHAYGIAIDIDPSLNTCCGCVPPWNDAPACKRAVKSEYGHMAMPECWVHAFERYGFYWLGHDVLKDTMHFEFLGDPERIVKIGTR